MIGKRFRVCFGCIQHPLLIGIDFNLFLILESYVLYYLEVAVCHVCSFS